MAAVSGVAVGNLLAAATSAATAPVTVVGSQIIDWTPTPVKEWAIQTFGTADKLFLSIAIIPWKKWKAVLSLRLSSAMRQRFFFLRNYNSESTEMCWCILQGKPKNTLTPG